MEIMDSIEESGSETSEVEFEPQPRAAAKPDGPEWWHRALRLDLEDRMEEAEQLLRDKIPNVYCCLQIAELYRQRWERLRDGDPVKTREARLKAAEWANQFAAGATSGGEGAALSQERDQFLRSLGQEPL
jgi:hypothetical protein